MEFRILGPLEVVRDGGSVPLGGAQQRAVLALLLIYRGQVVAADRLIDELWGGRAPPTAAKTLQGYVSNLRKLLPGGVIVTQGRGYTLNAEAVTLDLDHFEDLVIEGRQALQAGDAQRASDRLRAALGLWHGPPLADFVYEPFAQTEIARLEEERLAALEDRLDADLALGKHTALVGELDALVREHPLRERLHAQLMLALYRSGRQADALERYQEARHVLVDQLGIEPGPALKELERAILAQDSSLQPPRLPTAIDRLVGRSARRSGAIITAGTVLLLLVATAAAVLSSLGGHAVVAGRQGGSIAGRRVGSLVAIDPATDHIFATVPVGRSPGDIATGGGSIWVLDDNDQTISQIDPHTRQVVKTFGAGVSPTGLAFSDGSLWVGSSAGLPAPLSYSTSSVARIDPSVTTIPAEVIKLPKHHLGLPRASSGGSVRQIVASDGAVWVINPDRTLSRIDARSGRVVATISGVSAGSLALDPTGVWAIGAGHEGAVTLISSRTNSITDHASLAAPWLDLAAAGADALWVTDARDGTLWRVRFGGTTPAATTIELSQNSDSDVAVGAGSVWVTNDTANTVTRIDAQTSRKIKVIALPATPRNIAIGDGLVWVTVA